MTASPPSGTPVFGGVLAAALTPLTSAGQEVDGEAVAPMVAWLAAAGVDGVLALGTTGEGILLDVDERRRAVEAFVAAAPPGFTVIAHCGAQTSRDTATLCAHAAAAGARAAAVIAPPYFALDAGALAAHLAAAADACAPLPFFIYEFAARSGYAVPLAVIAELRTRCPNLAGLKVSDTPWERFEPYLLDGLAVFVGPEALIHRGLRGGAVGAVSGLAAALPEVVVEAVRHPGEASSRRAGELRAAIDRFPFHAALKRVLGRRGVPVGEAVRAPLRGLTVEERQELDDLVPSLLEDSGVVAGPV